MVKLEMMIRQSCTDHEPVDNFEKGCLRCVYDAVLEKLDEVDAALADQRDGCYLEDLKVFRYKYGDRHASEEHIMCKVLADMAPGSQHAGVLPEVHIALLNGDTAGALFLIQHDATGTALYDEHFKRNPLHLAARLKNRKFISECRKQAGEYFLMWKSERDVLDLTPSVIAVMQGDSVTFAQIHRSGDDLETLKLTFVNNSLLGFAIEGQHTEIVENLLGLFVNESKGNRSSPMFRTALRVALERDLSHVAFVRRLLQYGTIPSTADVGWHRGIKKGPLHGLMTRWLLHVTNESGSATLSTASAAEMLFQQAQTPKSVSAKTSRGDNTHLRNDPTTPGQQSEHLPSHHNHDELPLQSVDTPAQGPQPVHQSGMPSTVPALTSDATSPETTSILEPIQSFFSQLPQGQHDGSSKHTPPRFDEQGHECGRQFETIQQQPAFISEPGSDLQDLPPANRNLYQDGVAQSDPGNHMDWNSQRRQLGFGGGHNPNTSTQSSFASQASPHDWYGHPNQSSTVQSATSHMHPQAQVMQQPFVPSQTATQGGLTYMSYNTMQGGMPYNTTQGSMPYNTTQGGIPYKTTQGDMPYITTQSPHYGFNGQQQLR